MSDFILSQIVFIGFGMVAKSLLTLMLIKDALCVYDIPFLIIEPNSLESCDALNHLKQVNRNIKHIHEKITEQNYKYIFKKHIRVHMKRKYLGTCMQVAVSLLASIEWMIENPHMGIIEPEDVDTVRKISINGDYIPIFC